MRHSKAQIVGGRWSRNIPIGWGSGGQWRTDISKNVLDDERLREAVFICEGGPKITITAEELRRVLPGGPEHYSGKIWGPFTIKPAQATIDGHAVIMSVLNF